MNTCCVLIAHVYRTTHGTYAVRSRMHSSSTLARSSLKCAPWRRRPDCSRQTARTRWHRRPTSVPWHAQHRAYTFASPPRGERGRTPSSADSPRITARRTPRASTSPPPSWSSPSCRCRCTARNPRRLFRICRLWPPPLHLPVLD